MPIPVSCAATSAALRFQLLVVNWLGSLARVVGCEDLFPLTRTAIGQRVKRLRCGFQKDSVRIQQTLGWWQSFLRQQTPGRTWALCGQGPTLVWPSTTDVISGKKKKSYNLCILHWLLALLQATVDNLFNVVVSICYCCTFPKQGLSPFMATPPLPIRTLQNVISWRSEPSLWHWPCKQHAKLFTWNAISRWCTIPPSLCTKCSAVQKLWDNACVCVCVCVHACVRACVFDSFVFILRIWPITMNSDFEDSIPILSHGTPSLGTLKIIIYPFHVTHHLEVRCHYTKYGCKSLALWKTLSKQGPGTGTGKSNLLPPYPPNFITGVCVLEHD